MYFYIHLKTAQQCDLYVIHKVFLLFFGNSKTEHPLKSPLAPKLDIIGYEPSCEVRLD